MQRITDTGAPTMILLATALKYGYIYKVAANKANFIIDVKGDTVRIYHDKNNNGKIDEKPVTGWVKCGNKYQRYAGDGAAQPLGRR